MNWAPGQDWNRFWPLLLIIYSSFLQSPILNYIFIFQMMFPRTLVHLWKTLKSDQIRYAAGWLKNYYNQYLQFVAVIELWLYIKKRVILTLGPERFAINWKVVGVALHECIKVLFMHFLGVWAYSITTVQSNSFLIRCSSPRSLIIKSRLTISITSVKPFDFIGLDKL